MNFYDFHLHSHFSEGKSSIEEIAKRAKLLGFSGICFAEYFKNKKEMKTLKEKILKVSKKVGVKIFLGFEARTVSELKKLVKIRKEYDVLLVKGGDIYLNRKAVETNEVDILTHPEWRRKDSGLNHVMVKLARKNNTAIEINFREIVQASKNTRSLILKNISRNVMLCKKYEAPIIITSGAVSHWQLKDPKILVSMGCLLGLNLKEAKKSVSETPESIIRRVKERQNERWIMPGVRIVK